ncbi:HipA domain-containing protein [Blautia sp. Sow4_E7]|uniref:HipA domain-containing protein n=1 Tax=Blautia sp. Sow4_E7 TaxID=3438749 RepID=UPI003F918BB7
MGNYILMHKSTPVIKMELDELEGITRILSVYAPEHLPIGIPVKKNTVDKKALNLWWADRSIPSSRSGVQEALDELGLADTRLLLVRSFGLSLSDQYWIKPEHTDLQWEKINFFDNAFSDDIGNVLFGLKKGQGNFDFSSPDNTSDGCLKKRWKIIDGKRCLLKGGSNPFRQQPFNEVIASKIMDKLGIEHIPYSILWDNDMPYSVCEDFVTKELDLVSAWRIFQTRKKRNDVSVYQHYVNCCSELGVNVVPALDRMIVLDYIIANEDRHLNNFGLLRNAETLQWLGASPVFDSGSSLGYNKVPFDILGEREIICKPFKKTHDEQLKLISSFDWIDFGQLQDVGAIIRQVFGDERVSNFIDQKRIDVIVQSTEKRIQKLQAFANQKKIYSISTENDVTENIAENYLN